MLEGMLIWRLFMESKSSNSEKGRMANSGIGRPVFVTAKFEVTVRFTVITVADRQPTSDAVRHLLPSEGELISTDFIGIVDVEGPEDFVRRDGGVL
jgi:hypothetical protein